MANARTSFDLRTERLRTIDYRAQQSSPVVSSPTIDSDSTNNGEVDDWIKSVRALKERRQAEDEARNKQLEEDILRERRARQERRANRSRSVSPAKSLRSISEDAGDVSTKVAGDLVKDYRSVNHDALAETRELEAPQPIRSDPVRQATSPGTINTYLTEKLASPRNSDNAPRKSAVMVNPHHAVQPTEPEAHISNVMQSLGSSRTDLGFQNSPSRNGQSQAKAQIRSSPVLRTGRIFDTLPKPGVPSEDRNSEGAVGRPTNVAALSRATQPKPSLSKRLNPDLAALLQRKTVPTKAALRSDGLPEPESIVPPQSSSSSIPSSPSQSPREGAIKKLTHMTKSRPRRAGAERARASVSAANQDTSNNTPFPASEEPISVSATTQKKLKQQPAVVNKLDGDWTPRDRNSFPASPAEVSKISLSKFWLKKTDERRDTFKPVEAKSQNTTDVPAAVSDLHVSSPSPSDARIDITTPVQHGSSPFQKFSRSHTSSKSVSSLIGYADLIRERVGSSNSPPKLESEQNERQSNHIEQPQAQIPDFGNGITRAWRIEDPASTNRPIEITEKYNCLNEDETLIFLVGSQDTCCYVWRGDKSTAVPHTSVQKLVNCTDIREIHMGEETGEFVQLFDRKTIISLRAVPGAYQLFSVRRFRGGISIDQLPCEPASLCSGFVYILLAESPIVWSGHGSFPEELDAAIRHLGILKHESSTIVTLRESHETQEFWDLLGGKSQYASSAFWRLRRGAQAYDIKLHAVDGLKVLQLDHFSTRSLSQGSVHILDTYFEIYICLSIASTREEIAVAITWSKVFCRRLSEVRPFIPMVLVLCPGSKMPRDLRAVFRSPTIGEARELRLLELGTAESLLRRSRFTLQELRSGTMIGVSLDKPELSIEPRDFSSLMGIDRQGFQRLSASEQQDRRASARARILSP